MEYRYTKRNCWCRGCDKKLIRDVDKAVFMYSSANRGQHIMLCEDCVGNMFSMVIKEQLTEKGVS